jgi:hypothetical protein
MIDLPAVVNDLTDERPAKPTHYKVICISLYNSDLMALDAKVAELKRRGLTKMSRSELIRFALAELDVDRVRK